jgi:hypothetical protein
MPLLETIFFRFRVSRPKISDLVYQCLLDGLGRGVSQGLRQKYPYVLVLRFLPFERELLHRLFEDIIPVGLREEAKTPCSTDIRPILLFFRWSWASDVLRQILTEFDPTNSFGAPQGIQAGEWTQSGRFEMFKTFLRTRFHDFGHDSRHSRTEQLLNDNQEFVSRIAQIDWTAITVQPHQDDALLWRTLAILFRENVTTLRNWPGFRNVVRSLEESEIRAWDQSKDNIDDYSPSFEESGMSEGSDEIETIVDQVRDTDEAWDVWTLCRAMRQQTNGSTTESLIDEFVVSNAFLKHWKRVEISIDEENCFIGFLPRKKLELMAPVRPFPLRLTLFVICSSFSAEFHFKFVCRRPDGTGKYERNFG